MKIHKPADKSKTNRKDNKNSYSNKNRKPHDNKQNKPQSNDNTSKGKVKVNKIDYVLIPKRIQEQKKQLYDQERKIKDQLFKNSKKEKIIKTMKLNKKTNRGQPLMKDRMQMMYEKIQKTLGNS